jgi:hypothetical protein
MANTCSPRLAVVGRHADPTRIRYAQLEGAAAAIRDLVNRRAEREAAHRAEWPELWNRIDRLIEVVESRQDHDHAGHRRARGREGPELG